jgi:hypothetical protein
MKIEKWSWEIVLGAITIIPLATYLNSIAKTAWKDWFLETWPVKDVKKIFLWALNSIQWVIKIINHNWLSNRKVEKPKFKNSNTEIWIPNENWEYLYVPLKFYKIYTEIPENIFYKNAKLVDKERILEIWFIKNWQINNVKITDKEKICYYQEKYQEDSIILPELLHWSHVVLVWEITRTTESTNTIWFKYNWHILICKPLNQPLIYFKNKIVSAEENHFFSKVQITWIVDRENNLWDFKEKKPSILFTDIETIIENKNNLRLF